MEGEHPFKTPPKYACLRFCSDLIFAESGAYNQAVLTLKVMGFEVVLTIELVLTIARSYNRARTVFK